MTTSRAAKKSVPSIAGVFGSLPLLIATCLGIGLAPVAPGTFGSLPGIALAAGLLAFSLPLALQLTLLSALFVVGVWASGAAGRRFGKTDHGAIVIDEVVGQAIASLMPLWLLPGLVDPLWIFALSFLAFRVFDIIKPWPASFFDRGMKNPWGVMLDDFAAGVMAGAVVSAGSVLLL